MAPGPDRTTAGHAAVDLTGLGDIDPATLADVLRDAGARFALVHGSRVQGGARPDSDLDLAAWFTDPDTPWWELDLPDAVDLVPLRGLRLDVAGRIALHGLVVLDDDPPARVRWQADTRTRYLDESWRRDRATRDYLAARSGG